MARADLITQMRARRLSQEDFNFETLLGPQVSMLLTPTDLGDLNLLVKSPKYSSKPELKNQYQKEILGRRGFKWFHAGTNRNVYRFIEDQSFLLKVVHSRSGLQDNFLEYKNQNYIKPACTKVFDVSSCGICETVERVEPIISREQFISIAPYIFDLISAKLIGKYVLSDIGSKYFRNYGLRIGYGPVLLDFPYIYKLDGEKLICNHIDEKTGLPCGGVIDYDSGFNELHCEKCGLLYRATDLAQYEEENKIIFKGGRKDMRIAVLSDGKEIWSSNKETKKIERKYIAPITNRKAKCTISVEVSDGVTRTFEPNREKSFRSRKENRFKRGKVTVEGYEEKKEPKWEDEEKVETVTEKVTDESVETDINKTITDTINEYLEKDKEKSVIETESEDIDSDNDEEMENPFDEKSSEDDEVETESDEEELNDDGVKPFNPEEHPNVVPVVQHTRPIIKEQKKSARFDMNSDYWKTGSGSKK